MTRYRVATILSVLVFLWLNMVVWAQWPTFDRTTSLIIWFSLTTPAVILGMFNWAQETYLIYKRRRKIDRLLDTPTASTQIQEQ